MTASRRFLPSTGLLTAFEAVARTGSVTAAARELSLTQGAVSRQVLALEAQLGVALFERIQKRLHLTRAGARYADDIRQSLKQIASASLRIKSSPEGGVLNLAILPAFGTRWLAPRLAAFLAENPDVTVNLSTRIVPFDFATESFDAAIHFGQPTWPSADHLKLMEETVIPACAPHLLAKRPIAAPTDLAALPLLHLETRPEAWSHWMRLHGVDPPALTGMFCDQFAAMVQAAIHGVGVALVPLYLIERELAEGYLVSAYGGPIASLGSYYLASPAARADYPPLARFRIWLQRHLNPSDSAFGGSSVSTE